MYFAFTSLTTVGFGDYYPRSDLERLIGTGIIFLGVVIFSHLCDCFTSILDDYAFYHKILDKGDKLNRRCRVLFR